MPKTNRHLATFKFWIPCHSFNFFLFTNLGFFLHIFHNYISSGVVGWERVGTTFPHLSALVALLRTVARNSSLGGLYVCAGRLYVRAGGAWHSNLTKVPLIYNVSYFNFRELGALFGGAEATKSPPWRRDWFRFFISISTCSAWSSINKLSRV